MTTSAQSRPHPEVTLPIIPPTPDIPEGPTRDLLSALYEHDWRCYPADRGQAQVVSPDHVRSLVLRISPVYGAEDGTRFYIFPYADGQRITTAEAIDYVVKGSLP